MSSLAATNSMMVKAANRYICTQQRECHEVEARAAYMRHELLDMNTSALCSPAVHLRLVQLQRCRSSPVPGPAANKLKPRPFRKGRHTQGGCRPEQVRSLTRNRTLTRGRNLDNWATRVVMVGMYAFLACHQYYSGAHFGVGHRSPDR